MKKNIVLIETDSSMGTGILYPCRYEHKEPRTQSFIIFTNKHVLEGIGYEEELENMKEYCILHIYDDDGKIIESEDIKSVYMHVPVRDIYLYHDVAALLVCIADTVSISPETNIFEEELANREVLYMEGYPGVMLDDAVSQKVQLQGMAKSIFPVNEKMGVYQISDDYHWYNDFKDYKLMKGFSGGPVYIERNGKFYLIGMNQSVSDIQSGENPFKLAYYIKARYILEYLRETNGIVFRKEENNSYTIDWIANSGMELADYENEATLLLIGGSGAGKSSFALDFAYSKDKIHATNDGQTTRTNIVYDYSVLCDRPKAKICFWDEEGFIRTMSMRVGAFPYVKLWETIFNIEGNDVKDPMYYIKNCYYFFRGIKGSSNGFVKSIEKLLLKDTFDTSKIDKIRDIYEDEVENSEIISGLYEEAIEIMLRVLPVRLVKFVCDKKYLDTLISPQNRSGKEGIDIVERLTEQVSEATNVGFNEVVVNKIVDYILEYMQNGDYCSYQTSWKEVLKLLEPVAKDDVLLESNLREIRRWEIKKVLIKVLFEINGFFSLQEFDLQESDIMEAISDCRIIQKKEKEQIKIDYSDIYKRTYHILLERLRQLKNYQESKVLNYKKAEQKYIEIDIADMSESDEKLLAQCLQVTKDNKSWTGMIRSVYIKDRISNNYALIMKELKIRRIRILDTCGLDHISRDSNIMDTLYDIRVRYEMDYGIKPNEYSVVYVKKLDSGKPDELRNIIPQVYKVIPQAPIYCVLTGIDIFYKDRINEIQAINWSERNLKNCPKVVKYIFENKNELISGMGCSEDRKENMYRVLRNNLAPFCGNTKLVDENYAYFENNQRYVRTILNSIMIKEYACLEIVDIPSLKKYLQESERAENFLRMVFEKASEKDWDKIHPKTVTANCKRISGQKEKQLGFWRTYKHQWNQLFEDAYVYVANYCAGELLHNFGEGKGAVEAAILDISSEYLGSIFNLLLMEWENKNRFREILEEMYDAVDDITRERIYKHNPFKDDILAFDNTAKEREYMKDVNDFAKGYNRNADIRNQFVEFFIQVLCNAIERSNRYKTINIMNLHQYFTEAFDELIDMFEEKYGMDSSKVKLFMSFFQYKMKNRIG